MLPRSLQFAILACLALVAVSVATATAQGVYPGGTTVLVNNNGFSDPYAVQTANGAGGWLGSSPLLPNFQGLGLAPVGQTLSERLWLRGEYLYWRSSGMETPPLLTSSPAGTPQNRAAILGESGTRTLFGGTGLNDGGSAGVRTQAGFWISPQAAFGIEGEYFTLFGSGDGFTASGNGAPILGRPFFDTTNDRETSQLISFPGLANGSVGISSDTDLRSALINARAALLPTNFGVCAPCSDPDRVDWIVGYRHLQLDDRLSFSETIDSQVPGAPGTIRLNEQFSTENRFNGVQLGIVYEANFRRAWLESMLRVAVGSNSQRVNISGNTSITELGVTDTFSGGLLAQTSNIGSYRQNEFTMIPEIGLKLGFRITSCFHATVGYSVLYFPNVVRAGDQIDPNVNPNLIPEPNNPITGSLRPRFSLVETDFWAQGISVGGELRF